MSWSTHGADEVALYHLIGTGQLGRFWQVGPTGVMSYTIGEAERNETAFVLFANDSAERTRSATLSVPLTCPTSWFFSAAPDICPAYAPLISAGAEQPFERGTMIWLGQQGLIYVLFDDGGHPKWSTYPDTWEEGDPVADPNLTQPDGLYQPVRGFGQLWREEPGLRERLGWAIQPEIGYETAFQQTSYARYNDTFILAANNDIWRLLPHGSGWEKEPRS